MMKMRTLEGDEEARVFSTRVGITLLGAVIYLKGNARIQEHYWAQKQTPSCVEEMLSRDAKRKENGFFLFFFFKRGFLSVAWHGEASYDTLTLRGFSGFLTD